MQKNKILFLLLCVCTSSVYSAGLSKLGAGMGTSSHVSPGVAGSSGTMPEDDVHESREDAGDGAQDESPDFFGELTPDALAAHDASHGGAAAGGGRVSGAGSMHAGIHVHDEQAELQSLGNIKLQEAVECIRRTKSTHDSELFVQACELYKEAADAFVQIGRDVKTAEQKVMSYFQAGKAYLCAAEYEKAHACFASVRTYFRKIDPKDVKITDFEICGYTAIVDILLQDQKHFEIYKNFMLKLHKKTIVRRWMKQHFTEILQSLLPKDRVLFVEYYQKFMKSL